MLQANNNSNNDANDTQGDILKRLEKLNEWQEEQKKLLHERQNMQRQMLGMEQRSMYQMLGLKLVQPDVSLVTQVMASNNMMPGDGDHLQLDRYELKETRISKIDSELQDNPRNEDDLRVVEGEIQLIKTPQKPKRTFLKRGEGLKQRFKISPEALRLNNLPRYKYATSHPKVKIQRRKKMISGRSKPFNAVANDANNSPQMLALDAHEKQFQQLLISSKNVCNSTPDMKNSSSTFSSISITMPKVRFADMAEKRSKDNEEEDSSAQSLYGANNSSNPKISWSKVLDPQQIKPISVCMMRSKHHDYEKFPQRENVNDDSNLSIFELLEDQANNGTIDMNSSCIKTFMERKLREKLNEADIIHVDRRLKQAGIKPEVKELLKADILCSYEDDNDKFENVNNLEDNAIKTQVRVHFSDEHDTREYNYGSASDSSTLAEETISTSPNSSDLFQKFQNILYSALLNKVENGLDHPSVVDETDSSTALALRELPKCSATVIATAAQSPSLSPLTQELQAKSILIKTRLDELENEITTFKENNLKLLKAKQQHEMEKASFTEERLELMSRLNDSKIQMEIYLHDERMKIEDEKLHFEKQMRKLKATASSKDRKEILRLKQDLEQMQAQLKQKEQAHASAQARLRVQVRNLERDQKQLYEDIERLTKENKKLENQNVKIGRENNNKMLYEINRNIAKLAPKLTNSNENSNQDHNKNAKPKTSPIEIYAKRSLSKSFPKQKSAVKTTSPPPPSRSSSLTTIFAPLTQLKSNQQNFPHIDTNNDDIDDDDDDLTQELNFSPNSKKKLTQNGTQTESNVTETTNTTKEFKREIINVDGSKDIWYPNGNLKKISADGMVIRMLYFNQDIKETNINEGTVKYYYSETNTWHTTYLDGLEILEFPNGQTEHRYKNGIVEIHFPDNSIKITNPADATKLEEWRLADGTNLLQMRNGDKILMLPNGQKEIHTKLNKRREYPDGTVKLVYPDGSQETRYSNGRVRLKDKDGNLVMDTENSKG